MSISVHTYGEKVAEIQKQQCGLAFGGQQSGHWTCGSRWEVYFQICPSALLNLAQGAGFTAVQRLQHGWRSRSSAADGSGAAARGRAGRALPPAMGLHQAQTRQERIPTSFGFICFYSRWLDGIGVPAPWLWCGDHLISQRCTFFTLVLGVLL